MPQTARTVPWPDGPGRGLSARTNVPPVPMSSIARTVPTGRLWVKFEDNYFQSDIILGRTTLFCAVGAFLPHSAPRHMVGLVGLGILCYSLGVLFTLPVSGKPKRLSAGAGRV